jgi:hypothetical protein
VFAIFIVTYTFINDDVYSYSKRSSFNFAIGKNTPLLKYMLRVDWHIINGEYFPTKLPDFNYIWSRGDTVISKAPSTIVSGLTKDKGITSFDVKTNAPDSLELPLVYYKGYTAEINAERLPVGESSHGLVQIPVNGNEQGYVKVRYSGTIIQRISYCVSVVSIILLCLYIYRGFFRKKFCIL